MEGPRKHHSEQETEAASRGLTKLLGCYSGDPSSHFGSFPLTGDEDPMAHGTSQYGMCHD